MPRTYMKSKASARPNKAKTTQKTAAPAGKTEPVKKETSKAVIASVDQAVMKQIVYQKCSQILEREVSPNEVFKIGDDMPIYYL